MIELIKVKDYQELSNVAGKIMLELVQAKPDCTLGLATGSSPVGLYQFLIDAIFYEFSLVESWICL